MTIALAVVSVTLAIASILFAVIVPVGALLANCAIVRRNEDRNVSGTPIVGSIAGFLAVLAAPIGDIGQRLVWSWVPFAVELTLFGLCIAYWNVSGLKVEAERQRRSRRP